VTAAGTASRSDRGLQIREVAAFFGIPGGARLFGTTHVPAAGGPPRAGVLVCPSLCNDFLRNYGREVEWARWLAARGFAVQRFHYRGVGNSDGAEADITFATLVEDAAAAAAQLRELSGDVPMVFIGTRFGALVSTAAADRDPRAALVLIDPVTAGRTFFREAWRALMVADLGRPGAAKITTDQIEARLRNDGVVDVMGHAVHRRLHDTGSERTLLGELQQRDRPVLIVSFGSTARADHQSLAASLAEGGAAVEIEAMGKVHQWWVVEQNPRVDELLPTLDRWLGTRFPP
jgi:alpha/beta superfamily hydrolase